MAQGANIATRALDFKLKEFLNRSEAEQHASEYGYVNGATDQQSIFDNLPKIKAWIARNEDECCGKNGLLGLFLSKPIKCEEEYGDGYHGIWVDKSGDYGYWITEQDLPEGCNPQWEDKEPIEVELTIKMKG